MISPTLIIRRIVVDGDLTYDKTFYPGVNVVRAIKTNEDPRSTNGCGKTALVELIQHGLGRQQDSKAKFHFIGILDLLKTLFLEIETSSGIYTIERSLQNINAALRLHEGPYAAGIEKSPAELVKIEDASALMLDLVGIPRVSVNTKLGEPYPLSFPLLSRAFILHQEDSFGAILDKVQPESRKTDIIGFLTGVTPMDRFPLEEELGSVQIDMQKLEADINSVTRFLLDNAVPSVIEAGSLVETARQDLEEAKKALVEIQKAILQQQENDRPGHSDQTRRQLLSVKAQRGKVEQVIFGLDQEECRIQELIASLIADKKKSKHIQSSTVQLNSVQFQICPRCLQEISHDMQERELAGRCSLCNRPLIITSDTLPRRIVKTEDIDAQIEEAESILVSAKQERELSQDQLSTLEKQEERLSAELEQMLLVYVTPSVDRINAQASIVAERQAAFAKATWILGQAQALEKMQERLDIFRAKFNELTEKLKLAKTAQSQRQESLRREYLNVLRAVSYPGLRQVSIDSRTLLPLINGLPYSSNQGTAYKALATVAFHLALLNYARSVVCYFPKSLVIDSPNIGDLNEENHTKLLSYIAGLHTQEREATELDWQIILTTRFITPEMEQFVRDEISNPDQMLLRPKQRQ